MKYMSPDMEIIILHNENVISTSLSDTDLGGGTDDDVINAGSRLN